ncbi:MAG: PQQ-dependent sugar dehydrogenase [Flavobacteriaceae bacterium]|nr:PQQ-dependent sugar dehydrogenase [Flavobacteriaceae bacterium]
MLRIDVNDDSNNSYSIPNGNPFANDNNSRTHETIWAYGLRNPWKFSFDKETGEIWIADVGQNLYEEINVALGITGGINYGWRCYEGNHQYNLDDCPEKRTLTFPIAEYSHSNNGNFKCSVTGGYRYRGTKYPKFKGVYFFADYCSDEIGYLEEKNGKWEMNFTQPFKGNNWSTFGEGYRGELYLAGIATGKVFKIVDKEAFNNQVEFNVFYMKDKELIQVEFLKNQNLLKEVKVFSVTGKLIDHIKQAFSSASALSIETSNNYKKGVYIVQIILKNGQKESKRVVID